jgi:hypothetical protein
VHAARARPPQYDRHRKQHSDAAQRQDFAQAAARYSPAASSAASLSALPSSAASLPALPSVPESLPAAPPVPEPPLPAVPPLLAPPAPAVPPVLLPPVPPVPLVPPAPPPIVGASVPVLSVAQATISNTANNPVQFHTDFKLARAPRRAAFGYAVLHQSAWEATCSRAESWLGLQFRCWVCPPAAETTTLVSTRRAGPLAWADRPLAARVGLAVAVAVARRAARAGS